jgi:hypothetical protein
MVATARGSVTLRGGVVYRTIASGAMGLSPARLPVLSFLLPLYALPTDHVGLIIRTDGLDYMSAFAIATLTPVRGLMCMHHANSWILPFSLSNNSTLPRSISS